jgi:hypothetical protein
MTSFASLDQSAASEGEVVRQRSFHLHVSRLNDASMPCGKPYTERKFETTQRT